MYYKLTELSKMSGIPYITIYREIRDGKLQAVKIRNALYVYYLEWEKYVFNNYCNSQGFDAEKILEASKKMNNEQLIKASSLINENITNILDNANNLLKGKNLNKTTFFNTDEFLKQLGIENNKK